jgi:beta-mannosidase
MQLNYYARRFYTPLLVSPHVEDGNLAVYVVSDTVKPEQAEYGCGYCALMEQ